MSACRPTGGASRRCHRLPGSRAAGGLPAALLCVVDLVRPASGGERFDAAARPAAGRAFAAGLHADQLGVGAGHRQLPRPARRCRGPGRRSSLSQVVGTGRRLLGLAPAVSGRPLRLNAGHLSRSRDGWGTAPDAAGQRAGRCRCHHPGRDRRRALGLWAVGHRAHAAYLAGRDAPGAASANMEELARALSLGGSDPALSAVTSAPDEAARPAPRPRTRPQFPAISRSGRRVTIRR